MGLLESRCHLRKNPCLDFVALGVISDNLSDETTKGVMKGKGHGGEYEAMNDGYGETICDVVATGL